MEQTHRDILQTNETYLTENLYNVEEICNELLSDDILTLAMLDTIKYATPRPKGQTTTLLSILPFRGSKAFYSFIKALDGTENPHVADYLKMKDWSKQGHADVKYPSKKADETDLKMCTKKSFAEIGRNREIDEKTMEQKHRDILQTNETYLTRNVLSIEEICEYLVSDSILTQTMFDRIKHAKPRPSAQATTLLSILPFRGSKAFYSFIKALDETKNNDIADDLREKDKPKSTRRKRADDSLKLERYNEDIQKAANQHSTKLDEKTKNESGNCNQGHEDWLDLKYPLKMVKRSDIQMCTKESFSKIDKNREIYQMANAINRGKFILISNVQCLQCKEHSEIEDEKEEENSEWLSNIDFDKSSMSQLLKYMGYDVRSCDQVKNLTTEEIKKFLKRKSDEIDNLESSKYDSLVILFLSGKYECEPGKIYDCNGKVVRRSEILEIVKGCKYLEGKPKVIFVQTYNFQDKSKVFDLTEYGNDILKDGRPNNNDIFVVTNYPIVQYPWILGEHMSGSYFIQALIHVFKKLACKKTFMELLKEANMCLTQTEVPKITSLAREKKNVARIVVLEYCEGKDLYFFPGLDLTTI